MTGPAAGTALLDRLRDARRRLRRTLLAERVLWAVAATAIALVAAVAVDRVLRLPSGIRAAELAALVLGAGAWFVLRAVPAWRFRPPLVEVALRVERASGSRGIAIAADLAESGARDASRELADEAIRAGASAMPGAVRVDRGELVRAATWAGASLALALALALAVPETASIGLRRLVNPFAGVQWPARTMVEADMGTGVRPRGPALALRARHVRGDQASMRVEAEYRVMRDGSYGQRRRVVLPVQPDGAFERLVEADGERLEVVFLTEDMETPVVEVRLVPPPAVRSARLELSPPAYAAGSVDRRTADLGNGSDRRSIVSPPVLSGSEANLELTMEGAVVPTGDDARADWRRSTFVLLRDGVAADQPRIEVDPADSMRWTVAWRVGGRDVLEVRPVGDGGVGPPERIAFEVPSIEDSAPSVAIVEPVADEAVTPDAAPVVRAESRDDLGVTELSIVVTLRRAGGTVVPQAAVPGSTGAAASAEGTLDLRAMDAQPGDSVTCVARARDAFESDGRPRDAVESAPRVFRIIAPSELSDQVRARLGQMREAAGRLRQEQAEIRARTEALDRRARGDEARDPASPGTDGAAGSPPSAEEEAALAATEARLSERVTAFDRSLEELTRRLERNRAEGDGLREVIDEARAGTKRAAERAQGATRALEQAGPDEDGARPGQPAEPADARRRQQGRTGEAVAQAREAERALADVEAALQRDRETAELSRRIDRLAERIDAAGRESREATDRAVGRTRDQLDAGARAELDRAAQEQREAAAEARDLAEDLSRRADEVEREERPEPGVPESLREAAREAEEQGLARSLEQAAQQTQQNQGQASRQSQEQARQAVEAMQEAIRNQRRGRQEELRRRMVDLSRSIGELLARVEERVLPMQRLAANDAEAIDAEAVLLIRLSRQAAGLSEQAGQAGNAMQRAGELLTQGSAQLDGSASALRGAPPAGDVAQESLGLARTSIQEALEAAERARADAARAAENARRAELRDVYTRILDRQRTVRGATEAALPAPGAPAGRRTLLESRRLGTEQSAVSGQLRTAASREDLSRSELFKASTDEMEGASSAASQDLWQGAPSSRTVLLQREVEAGIAALIEALADPPTPEDPFAEEPERAGGGEGGGAAGAAGAAAASRVPPIAELRLLRNMAQRVLDDTAAASALGPETRDAYLARVAQRQQRIVELGQKWAASLRPPEPTVVPEAQEGGEP